ncbi:MAG: sigma-70 family RNA polymerase sigma factor [Pseudomonadota bacterium]
MNAANRATIEADAHTAMDEDRAVLDFSVMDDLLPLAPERAKADRESAWRELLARIAAGEHAAVAELYDASAARVYALARHLTRDAMLAEDVVSDVYLQIWQQAGRYDAARGGVLTWLLTICRSRALDALRRREPAEPHADPYANAPDPHAAGDDPIDLLNALEGGSRIHIALATLGATERQLISAAYFEDLSHTQIAARTGMPLGTVKTVLRRAVQMLRAALEHNLSTLEKTP